MTDDNTPLDHEAEPAEEQPLIGEEPVDAEPETDSVPEPEAEDAPAGEPEAEDELAGEPADAELTAQLDALSAEAPEDAPAQLDEDAALETALLPPVGEAALTDADAAAAAAATVPAAVAADTPAEPRDIDLGPEKRSGWWVWVLVGIAVLAVIGAAGYAWWNATSRPISVPDVVGKQPAEATQILNDLDLRLGDVSEIPTDVAPAGTIVSQKPEAGSTLKPDEKVSFVVAAPPTTSEVPNVSGKSQDEAEALLAEARLRPYVVQSYASTAAAGFVMSQLPTSGAEVAPGASVAIVVSKGPAPVSSTVPQLGGLPEADAVSLTTANGLKPVIYRSFNASVAVGVVVTQTPLPRSVVSPGSTVQILVSQGAGAAPITIPNVVGQQKDAAVTTMKNKKLKPEVRTIPDPAVPKGQVLAQMPPHGTKTVEGGVVGLLVSAGPLANGTVPSLIGTSSTEATKAITAAGFKPVIVEVEMPNAKYGTVLEQYPAPGTQYPKRFPVVCLVAIAPKP